ncbi:FAD-dependent oxidoreductase [Clostridium sp. A1-XYC3]|uniref:FAD-dependent oxidoreductase n=1 Tax=Clostridium tanneri TaxID=3037988 RepID=A0ABU4JY69_9CLOT|nr:FAD-dependent oxidoreductase [Clostridium sp. A1-XYC3]MDW8803122.1 FAD-dependent oxidoreductase [Clostridium sp. A1-XYC3]
MSNLKYKHLFEPIQLGKTLFRNRIFASPQDYPGLTSNRFLTEEAAYFYERKAVGGFASVCVGDMIIDAKVGRSHPFQMRGNDFMGKVSLTRTSTAIARHGAVAAIELCHAGQNASLDLMDENKGFVYGPVDGIRPDGVKIRAMNDEQIEDLIMSYSDAAAFARQCGFGMITLHGGHGWQMTQFISERDNKRKDKWGGSIENRMRFPLAVIEAIRKRIGYAIPIEFRMSGTESLPDGYDIDEGIEIAKVLDGKVDVIHVSVGHHEIDSASMVTHPPMFLPDGCNVKYAAEIKKYVKTPVATVGALTNPEMMEEIIASGQADIINLGRQSLADPDLPIKARIGLEDEINPCLRCFNCFSNSTVGGVFYCASNPEIGREQSSMTAIPPLHKKTVLVAGGGIGGMQAALTAAKRGHKVILCEKSDKLGGALLCEENIPFKANLSTYLKQQALKVSRAQIEVHLNTEVTPEVAESFKPDVIIAAIGARPMIPIIKGIDSKNVVGAEQVYYNPEITGKNAVIMGGGLVGLELGIFLSQKGHNITIVEMANGTIATPPPVTGTSNRMSGIMDVSLGHPLVHGVALKEELKKLPNIKICSSTKALEITEEGLIVEDTNGIRTIEADTIIYAIGQKPLREEAYALSDCAPEFYQIGDCVTPKNIYEATSVAYQIAMDIGRF